MKTHLIVDVFEMHILYRNGCQKQCMHRGGGGSEQGPKGRREIVNKIRNFNEIPKIGRLWVFLLKTHNRPNSAQISQSGSFVIFYV